MRYGYSDRMKFMRQALAGKRPVFNAPTSRYGRAQAPEITHCSKQRGVLVPLPVHECRHAEQVVPGAGTVAGRARQNSNNPARTMKRFMVHSSFFGHSTSISDTPPMETSAKSSPTPGPCIPSMCRAVSVVLQRARRPLFTAQRHHGIELGRAARRKVARQERSEPNHENRRQKNGATLIERQEIVVVNKS